MQNYACKNCGAVLYWDAHAGCLKCEFCDHTYQVSDFEDKTAIETKEPIDQTADEVKEVEYLNEDLAEGMVAYECKTCGGTVVTLKTTMADICPYCGEAISITSKSVGEFRPKMVIPFEKKKQDAINIFKQYVTKTSFVPKLFKQNYVIEKIQGLYAPFYLHNITDQANHLFGAETSTSVTSGNYRVTTHRVYDLTSTTKGTFTGIPTDASVRLDNKLMEAIEPYEYNDLKDYNPAYMAGYLAEQCDEDVTKMDEIAETKCKTAIDQEARGLFAGYGVLTTKSATHNIMNHSKDYCMLPVWVLNVKYNGKKYQYAINGQTGKVTGKLPLNKPAVFAAAAAVFAAADVICAIALTFM